MKLAGRRARLSTADSSVTARVGIGRRPEGGYGLTVELAVLLPELPREEAEALVARADSACPYSNAVRGNIDVRLVVRETPEVV